MKTSQKIEVGGNWKKLAKKLNYEKVGKKKISSSGEGEKRTGLIGNSKGGVNEENGVEEGRKEENRYNQDGKIGKYIGMDCEMVGVGDGGLTSVLARCSLINYNGKVIYDEYCVPIEEIRDYRSAVSGITPRILKEKGKPFKLVQKQVADIIKDKIIVGHALKNDLHALMLQHPAKLIRDTAKYKPLKNEKTNSAQSLKNLAKKYLDRDIQGSSHSSVEDAQSAMDLYKMHKKEWDQSIYKREKINLKPHSW